jgi:hypothetical protein
VRAIGIALAFTLVVAGCRGSDAPPVPPCPPATISHAGVPVEPLAHGLGYVDDDGRAAIIVFNHARATCGDLLARDLPVVLDEVRVEVSTGGGFTGIEYAAPTARAFSAAPRNKSTLVIEPTKVGGPMAICARGSLDASGEVVIDGLFEGTYCGPRPRLR